MVLFAHLIHAAGFAECFEQQLLRAEQQLIDQGLLTLSKASAAEVAPEYSRAVAAVGRLVPRLGWDQHAKLTVKSTGGCQGFAFTVRLTDAPSETYFVKLLGDDQGDADLSVKYSQLASTPLPVCFHHCVPVESFSVQYVVHSPECCTEFGRNKPTTAHGI